MLTIDGSFGEGGGQVLRTSLALSLVTGRAFRMERIRAGRKKPGLMRQHLTAVQAAAKVGRAEVNGAEIGSQQVTFVPGGVVPGDYRFAVGTAGSVTLVLQTVLPALLTASGPSSLVLEGGTHNPFAPPFDFLDKTFLPVVNRLGPTVVAKLDRPGFYPAGGGRFRCAVQPCAGSLARLDLRGRGAILGRRARAVVAGLPRHIAEREIRTVERHLGWDARELTVEELPAARGPGNVVIIEVESEQVTEVVTAFGQRGVRAETVAEQACLETAEYLEAEVPVGVHLADQLILPMALAGGGSFETLGLTEHTRTNIEVVRQFLDLEVSAEPLPQGRWLVKLGRLWCPSPRAPVDPATR